MLRHINFVILISGIFYGQCFAVDISNFAMTVGTYAETENLEQIVQSEFGAGYRIADWNDIVNYYNDGNSVEDFKAEFGLGGMITYNGNHWYNSTRHYLYSISERPGKTPHVGYLSHANIDNHKFDLGSWYNLNMHILVYTDNPTSQPQSDDAGFVFSGGQEYGWGKRPEQFGLQEGEEIETFGPHTFSLDSQENMYVVDTINGKIKILNAKGEYQRNIDFTGWASDIVTGHNKELFILDSDSLVIYPLQGNMIRHKLSTEISKIEGYGQGVRFDHVGNLYLCQFQQCYQVGVAQKGNVTKILRPDEQMENINPGFPIKGNKWIRTVWKNNHEAVIEIMDDDWTIVQSIPMKTDDIFGMVGFLRQDDNDFLYIEVERITNDNYVHLEVWQYDKTGQRVSVTELPNDYYSTVYKKVLIDSKGKIRQVITTHNGVRLSEWTYVKKLAVRDCQSLTRDKYKKVVETTAPRGCWCSGPRPKPVSNLEARNNEPGGHERDGITVTLSDPVEGCDLSQKGVGFRGFLDPKTFFMTRKIYCIDPECGTNYTKTETWVKKP